jgi:hypothetical protein
MAISRSDMERQLKNMGGIMSLQEPRQGYFIGKLVKKAKKAVKKVVKSPIGKIGLGAALLGGLGGAGGIGKFFGKGSFNPFMAKGKFSGLGSLLNKAGLVSGTGGFTGLGKLASIAGVSGLGGLLAAKVAEDEDDVDISDIDRGEGLDIDRIVRLARMNDPQFRFLPGAEFTGAYAEGGEVMNPMTMLGLSLLDKGSEMGMEEMEKQKKLMELLQKLKMTDPDKELRKRGELEELRRIEAEKRINKAEGGIMDLGGMEMDLRGGGFVPLGAKEKADDVPARLSKNEFVMTADAVRAAGGGSVDKGADKMYKMMKNLEAQV